jgi:hypothetical protein
MHDALDAAQRFRPIRVAVDFPDTYGRIGAFAAGKDPTDCCSRHMTRFGECAAQRPADEAVRSGH